MIRTEIVHVCGIPGSGKTYYCEWLERRQGFLHLDFDQLLRGQGTEPKLSLIELLRGNPHAFIARLSQEGHPAVIDWGFPLSSLPVVRLLQEKGVVIWWFDGNREAARQAFITRGDPSPEDFQIQLNSIESNWPAIKDIIGARIIETVAPGPTHATPEWIFEQMFAQKS